LPAAVRFTLLGALDHDPAVELLIAVGAVGARRRRARSRALSPAAPVVLPTAGLAALPLTWTGSELHFG
jgi:hypothetical protein